MTLLGLSRGHSPADFDPYWLKVGTKVERLIHD